MKIKLTLIVEGPADKIKEGLEAWKQEIVPTVGEKDQHGIILVAAEHEIIEE